MKKTITILLLTALCMTVLTSCDFGNGLVAELLGDIKDAGVDVDYYPTDVYVPIQTDVVIDIDPPISDDLPDCGMPDIMQPIVYNINTVEYAGYDEVETILLETDIQAAFPNGLMLSPRKGLNTVGFGGWVGVYDPLAIEFGYSLNGQEPVYEKDYEVALSDGAGAQIPNSVSYATGFMICVPINVLEDGYNEITLLCNFPHSGYTQELITINVFKEAPTVLEKETYDVSYDAVDTVEPAVEETLEEITINTEDLTE